MARTIETLPRQERRRAQAAGGLLLPVMTLAFWRLRQTWRLLLFTGLGMLAAVMLTCSTSLYTQVGETAGVRGILTASPENRNVTLEMTAGPLSTGDVAQVRRSVEETMQQQLGTYLQASATSFVLQTKGFDLVDSADHTLGSFSLTGVSIPQAASHLTLLQGRLPRQNPQALEVVITPNTAAGLHLKVGDQFPLRFIISAVQGGIPYPPNNGYVVLRQPVQVVGLFTPHTGDSFWHGKTFESTRDGEFPGLVSTEAFLATLTQLAAQHGWTVIFLQTPVALIWYYSLDVLHITIRNLPDVIARLRAVQARISNLPAANPVTLLGLVLSSGDSPSVLERYGERLSTLQMPVLLLLFQVLALVFFFVGMLSALLIERQAESIALLRSRGATRHQIFGSFLVQGLLLGLLALIAGPALALLAVSGLISVLLPANNNDALNVITSDPLQAALSVGWLPLVAVGGAVLALLLALWGAARRDVLALRRESARSAGRPLWQRVGLDAAAVIIALTGFVLSLSITQTGILDARTEQLLALPLTLVAPFFLAIAGVLLFLRGFPLALRVLARQAARRPGASPMLALARMARAPQATARLILLLAFATVFVLMALVFNASEAQQIRAMAAHQAGADFSGPLANPPLTQNALLRQEAAFRALPGITAVSFGSSLRGLFEAGNQETSVEIRAVDPASFAQAAIWPSQESSQPLTMLLADISNQQAQGIPAVVDMVAWKALRLSPGASISFYIRTGYGSVKLPLVVVAQIQHIPTINDSLAPATPEYGPPGGVLVNVQTLNRFFQLVQAQQPLASYVWMRSNGDPAALSKIRLALSAGPLRLAPVYDRLALIAAMQEDPLFLTLTGVLELGAITTMLLALVSSLLMAWVSAQSRLTSFALLRALGSAPRQIARIITWEQGITYTVALALGLGFGALLVITVVPAMIFTNPPYLEATTSGEFFSLQHLLPAQVVIPGSLGIALAALLLTCVMATALMAHLVARPSISQALRLNED